MVRGNILPTAAAVFSARSGNWIGFLIGMAIFCIGILIAIVRYATFRYRVCDGELIVDQGVFARLHRTIPLQRIQNIDLSQNLFHRLFKVGEVRVETGSGKEPEAVMRVLTIAEYARLKSELTSQRKSESGASEHQMANVPTAASAIAVADPQCEGDIPAEALPDALDHPLVVLALSPRLVALAGLLSNRGEVIAGLAIGFLWQLRFAENWVPGMRFGSKERESAHEVAQTIAADSSFFRGMIGNVRDNFGSLGLFGMVAVGAMLLFGILRLFSAVWYVLKFYGYRLESVDRTLHLRCGLFTKVSATIPLGRVQFISVHRNWLARRFGLASIRIETAGGGGKQSEDAASSIGRKWFVPVLRYEDVPRVLAAIDPRIEFNDSLIGWQPISKDAGKRMMRGWLLTALVSLCVGLFVRPLWGWIPGVLVGLFGAFYVNKKKKSRRYARTDWGIVYRSGTLVQKCSMTFFEKIQSAKVNQSPFDRRWKMGSLVVDNASAGPADHLIKIKLLDADFVAQEFSELQTAIWNQKSI
jgi:putative membrane protein